MQLDFLPLVKHSEKIKYRFLYDYGAKKNLKSMVLRWNVVVKVW
jgi:hypothetical protein